MIARLEEGVFFFNQGRYFEAHEAWEEVWRASEGSIRDLFQGLVQAAVGMHHWSRGNHRGARLQLEKSLVRLDRTDVSVSELDVALLREDLRKVLTRLELGDIGCVRIRRLKRPGVVVESQGTVE